jgi:hypothetical protein
VCEGYVQAVKRCFLNVSKSGNWKNKINENKKFFFTVQHLFACMLNNAVSEQVLQQLTEMYELEF